LRDEFYRQLTKPGDSTSVRFFFAFLRVNECYGDISTIENRFRGFCQLLALESRLNSPGDVRRELLDPLIQALDFSLL
jgi:hypothetical protein